MKFNWGFGITVTITLFVTGILFMVYKSSQQKIELIEEDYYAAEIAYQGKIDKKENLVKLNKRVQWTVSDSDGMLNIPGISSGSIGKGTVRFICPSDKTKDRQFTFEQLEEGVYKVPLKELSANMYKLEVEWSAGSMEYLDEKIIHIR